MPNLTRKCPFKEVSNLLECTFHYGLKCGHLSKALALLPKTAALQCQSSRGAVCVRLHFSIFIRSPVIGLESIPMTSLELDYLHKDPISNYSHNLRYFIMALPATKLQRNKCLSIVKEANGFLIFPVP